MRTAAWASGREAETLAARPPGWWRRWGWRGLSPEQRLGRMGEDLAARALRRKGYRVLARNLRRRAGEALPCGEIDLLAREGGETVWVEVKTRARRDPRYPAEAAVDERKRHYIERFARRYARRRREQVRIRCDVVIIYQPESPRPEILLYRDILRPCLNSAKTL